MKTGYYLFALTVLLFYVPGCSDHKHDTAPEHEHPAVSVTLWTDSTELFMEYPRLSAGADAEFLIHLSVMKTFKAVTEGTLTVEFTGDNGKTLKITESAPKRAGIYVPVVRLDAAGTYQMTIRLNGAQVSDEIRVENIIVYPSEGEIPHEEEDGSSEIGFLKEQQWKIDFATQPAAIREMQSSFKTSGEITVRPDHQVKVVSPVAGTITPKHNRTFPRQGIYVKSGDVLITLSPTADASAGIEKVKNDFLLSEKEYERVKKLYAAGAVSGKRLDESKFDFEAKQAGYNALLDQVRFTSNGYALIAPVSGYIENVMTSPGSQTAAGQELFTIINPSRLLLKVNVPANKFLLANETTDASFTVEGYNTELTISKLNGKKVSVSSVLNPENRTLPVYFEFSNPDNKLKGGIFAEVSLKTSEKGNYLSIPESAIVDEDRTKTVYIQASGESFQKRTIKTGASGDGYIQIVEGVHEGERVVTRGAYQIRLAALSPESAIGSGHVH
ncbi:MAG: efflux RND transporter periplasmic adaptor subunit [Ignavibacteriales bacterium]|nr:Multidrug resistance protein MdtA [Ignavibacteriaceae bacterium]QOJ30277.1 MAG: efflux RND transporter periplasmic adaptor subunit [Ignavibacteriales bacterium]